MVSLRAGAGFGSAFRPSPPDGSDLAPSCGEQPWPVFTATALSESPTLKLRPPGPQGTTHFSNAYERHMARTARSAIREPLRPFLHVLIPCRVVVSNWSSRT